MPLPEYLDITQDDIDHGVRRNCRECPVARAAKRAFWGAAAMFSFWRLLPELRVEGYGRYRVIGGEEFANRFDRGESVQPCRLKLELIQEASCEL